jgi:hypothetical protein
LDHEQDDGRSTMRFNHCCFVSLTLPGGNHHISVKVFKSGRLQTAGCINGEMSLQACRVIGSCLQQIAADGCTDTVVKGDVPAELLHQLANEASYNVSPVALSDNGDILSDVKLLHPGLAREAIYHGSI